MATIPIATAEIITPYVLVEEETVDVLQSSSKTTSVISRGGNRWMLLLAIAPINIRKSPGHYDELNVFFATKSIFSVPLTNTTPNKLTGSIAVSEDANVGSTKVILDIPASNGQPNVGQLITFSNKSKVYRVASHRKLTSNRTEIILTKPLRQSLDTYVSVIYSGTDGASETFDGVLGSFVNVDYGRTNHRVDQGILAKFGPLKLIEAI